MLDFLKIKYQNSCDLAGSLFTVPDNSFYYTCFLPCDLGPNTYEVVDEGREDGEKNFVSDFKKLVKKYSFVTVVPEYLYDSLCHVQLHDMVYITTKYGETSRAFNFGVELNEWLTNAAKITVTFTVDYAVKYGCCNNEKQNYVGCVTCKSIKIEGIISDSSVTFEDPITSGVQVGSSYVVYDPFGRFTIYTFSTKGDMHYNITGVWTPYATNNPLTGVCFTLDGVDYKFYYNGHYWLKYQMIDTITDSGSLVNVKGFVLPNTWVQVYKSTDGVNYSVAGNVTNGNTFMSAGVNVAGLTSGVLYYFKFSMYNNNCDYGYSNVKTVVKS